MNTRLMRSEMKAGHAAANDTRLLGRRSLAIRRQFLAFSSTALLLCVSTAPAVAASAEQNWPQWRGPLGTGVAPLGNPPTEWSETKNVKWKVKIPGGGHATPIIWEDKVFLMAAIPTGKK